MQHPFAVHTHEIRSKNRVKVLRKFFLLLLSDQEDLGIETELLLSIKFYSSFVINQQDE